MIDNLVRTESLLAGLQAALPLPAIMCPPLAKRVEEELPGASAGGRCVITDIRYAGDEGGIVCRFEASGGAQTQPYFVSLTYFLFDHRTPLAREIAQYAKHRIKRIRREGHSARY